MTKDEICRAIAEKLEEKPVKFIAIYRVSEKGFWHGRPDTASGYGWAWDAVNFYESEDASARLLEAMPDPKLFKVSRFAVSHWVCEPSKENHSEYGTDQHRKTAIVLGACKWLKIEAEAAA